MTVLITVAGITAMLATSTRFRRAILGSAAMISLVGLGLTSNAAAVAGMRFIGAELHPRWLANAIQDVASVLGVTPHRVS